MACLRALDLFDVVDRLEITAVVTRADRTPSAAANAFLGLMRETART